VGGDFAVRIQYNSFGLCTEKFHSFILPVVGQLDKMAPERFVEKLIERHGRKDALQDSVGVSKDHGRQLAGGKTSTERC
jgi:hypothetical protein